MLSLMPSVGHETGDEAAMRGDGEPYHGFHHPYSANNEEENEEHHAEMSEAYDSKKNTKPVMEKRRRARINHCLGELKSLIVDAISKDPSRHSKLEKADILELTVKHLQEVQKKQIGAAVARDPSVLHKFRNGFAECAGEVNRYVSKIESVDSGMKHRLVNHLGQCVSGLRSMSPMAFTAMTGVRCPSLGRPLQEMNSSQQPLTAGAIRPQMNQPMSNSINAQPNVVPHAKNSSHLNSTNSIQNVNLPRKSQNFHPQNKIIYSTPMDNAKQNFNLHTNGNISHSNNYDQKSSVPLTRDSNNTTSSYSGSSSTNCFNTVSSTTPLPLQCHPTFPVTPQNSKYSPTSSSCLSSSSSSSSSPESSNASPPSTLTRPIVKKINPLNGIPSMPSQPSIKLNSDALPFGNLFSNKGRPSAFTAVRTNLSVSEDVSSVSEANENVSPTNENVVVDDIKRVSPVHVITPDQTSLQTTNLHQYNLLYYSTLDKKAVLPKYMHSSYESPDISNTSYNGFLPQENISRKRSLDSILDTEDTPKLPKMDLRLPSEVLGSNYIMSSRPEGSIQENRRHSSPGPRPQNSPVEDKDMWRPW